MLVNLVVIFVYLFLCQHLVLRISLILYVVTCGPLPSLASAVTNTIWSFSTIAHSTCGHFLYVSSPTPFRL
uniref:Uncharacterized protein n=1 Tax=Arundo donax TaxID=35708 RepID=A0A0A9B2W2_ARUDO